MPKKVAKKTTHIPKKTVPEVPTLKGVGEHIWDGVKDVGNGLLMLIKVILNFITWIFGGSIILILIIVLGIFLIFTAFGIKENPEWQNYINLKIGQLIKLESGIEEVVTEELDEVIEETADETVEETDGKTEEEMSENEEI